MGLGQGFELDGRRLQRRRSVAAEALPEGGCHPNETRGGLHRLGGEKVRHVSKLEGCYYLPTYYVLCTTTKCRATLEKDCRASAAAEYSRSHACGASSKE